MTETDRERAIRIATVALHRAQAEDLPGAADYVKRLSGTDGLITAVLAWIDTYIARVWPQHTPGQRVRVRWYHVPDDQVETADEVSPSVRWAGQLIAARAVDDEPTFMAILRSPAEGVQLGDAVMALLHIVATGLNDPQLIHDVTERVGGTS